MPLGQHSTAFDGEIETICTALRLLNLHQNKFERVVIFSDSKAAILFAGLTETVISTEAIDCQALICQLKAKHTQIVLQWIPGHSQIAGNEYADTLAKKGTKITQTHIREASYHSIKLHLKQVFQSAYRQGLGTKLFQKPWKQELAKIPDWPKEGQLQSFDCTLGMIAWEHIFTALEFVPTTTACCAASTKPWTETILDDVPHYPVGHSVNDTGRPGQKWWRTDFSLSYYSCDYCLSLGLLCLFWMVLMFCFLFLNVVSIA